MDRIEINGYESSRLDGCHVLADTTIVAYVPEPVKRAEHHGEYGPDRWTEQDEATWRQVVREKVLGVWGTHTDDGTPVSIQWDPGRDECEEEDL